jgi:cell wall-associated NlpC family hydrolase
VASVSDRQIRRASQVTGVPYWMLKAQIGQESGGRQGAVSPKGAFGVEQLLPSTAAYEGRTHHLNTHTPFGNLLAGAFYLREQYNTFKRWDYALAAYNAGPGAVHKYGGIPPYSETQNYVKNIMSHKGSASFPVGAEGAGSPSPSPSITGGQSSGAFAPAPTFTKEDAALQGLGALASGNYDPTLGLQALQKAAKATEAAQAAPPTPGTVGGLTQAPIRITGKITKKERQAVNLIQEYLGTPYHWGGSQPGGFDCSGLLQYVWGRVGVQIPRTTYEQWKTGRPVVKSLLSPGDAVFFEASRRGPGHVGMYIGHGKFIEAPHTGANVRISKLAGRKDYIGARRYA